MTTSRVAGGAIPENFDWLSPFSLAGVPVSCKAHPRSPRVGTDNAQSVPFDRLKFNLYMRTVSLLLTLCFSLVARVAFAAAEPAAPPAQPDMAQYVIGPGDVLQVYVWRNPELSVTVPVRPDGQLSSPLVENMRAVGKTPSELARDIENVLSEFVRSPKVNVIVTQPASASSQVRVVGQVARPQALPFRDGMTVLDAVLQVGGLGPFAAGNRAQIIRVEKGSRGERKLKVRLVDLLNKGDMKQNLPLQSGDVLMIPESLF